MSFIHAIHFAKGPNGSTWSRNIGVTHLHAPSAPLSPWVHSTWQHFILPSQSVSNSHSSIQLSLTCPGRQLPGLTPCPVKKNVNIKTSTLYLHWLIKSRLFNEYPSVPYPELHVKDIKFYVNDTFKLRGFKKSKMAFLIQEM